ncbi:uncharacterized protein L201_001578 [Kwoniella dendrophila CBS 6074]|uniref:Uncharacterized protein n=1 Tax=Kwoniella dendrophila CBS 6074 TaxID=1295534 RepID=A0AAX4JMQ5_9TREE
MSDIATIENPLYDLLEIAKKSDASKHSWLTDEINYGYEDDHKLSRINPGNFDHLKAKRIEREDRRIVLTEAKFDKNEIHFLPQGIAIKIDSINNKGILIKPKIFKWYNKPLSIKDTFMNNHHPKNIQDLQKIWQGKSLKWLKEFENKDEKEELEFNEKYPLSKILSLTSSNGFVKMELDQDQN